MCDVGVGCGNQRVFLSRAGTGREQGLVSNRALHLPLPSELRLFSRARACTTYQELSYRRKVRNGEGQQVTREPVIGGRGQGGARRRAGGMKHVSQKAGEERGWLC